MGKPKIKKLKKKKKAKPYIWPKCSSCGLRSCHCGSGGYSGDEENYCGGY